ncbi:uncharacterized protein LOC144604424 [Rhinoraja longicauda]
MTTVQKMKMLDFNWQSSKPHVQFSVDSDCTSGRDAQSRSSHLEDMDMAADSRHDQLMRQVTVCLSTNSRPGGSRLQGEPAEPVPSDRTEDPRGHGLQEEAAELVPCSLDPVDHRPGRGSPPSRTLLVPRRPETVRRGPAMTDTMGEERDR